MLHRWSSCSLGLLPYFSMWVLDMPLALSALQSQWSHGVTCMCTPYCCHLWQQKMCDSIKNQLCVTEKEQTEAACAIYEQGVLFLDQLGDFKAYLCSRSTKGLLQMVKHFPTDLAIEWGLDGDKELSSSQNAGCGLKKPRQSYLLGYRLQSLSLWSVFVMLG